MATHSSILAWRIPGTRAWWAAVYGVTQSWTWLKELSSSSRLAFHRLQQILNYIFILGAIWWFIVSTSLYTKGKQSYCYGFFFCQVHRTPLIHNLKHCRHLGTFLQWTNEFSFFSFNQIPFKTVRNTMSPKIKKNTRSVLLKHKLIKTKL